MIRRNIGVYYLLIMEAIFGGLIISLFFSLQGKEVPLQAYFLIILTSCFTFVFLLEKFKDTGKWLFLLLILPSLLIVGNLLDFSFLLSLLISFLIFWRTLSNFYEQEKQNEGKWLLLTILLGIFVLFMTKSSSVIIISLMISQIFFILVGRFVKQWLELDALETEKRQFLIPFVTIILFIVISGLLFTAGMNAIKWLFFFILKMVVAVLVFIAMPFFNWAESQDWSVQIEKVLNNEGDIGFDFSPLDKEQTETIIPFDPMSIITILIILSIVFLFLYIYRRKKAKDRLLTIKNDSGFSDESSYLPETSPFFRIRKTLPPSDQIRKEIFNFERYARKHHFGREHFESLSDWMKRIGLSNFEAINSIYEKVRYGESVYTEKEAEDFKNDMEIKKREIKDMAKK